MFFDVNLKGMNIRELRLKNGLSQADLAEKTGIPKGRINGWEQQGTHPKANDAAILQAFFSQFENKHSYSTESRTIPFWDAVAVGGLN